MSAVHDAFGSHIGYLAVARDMSDSQRSQKILVETLEKDREATARLHDLDRAKNDFVSMVSHEIRTPITNIVGYTEMLQDGAAGPLSREQDRLLDAVRRNGRRLIGLIDDLLTLSRIESGSFHMARTQVDLLTVFDRAHESVDPLVAGRHLGIDVDLPHQPVLVLGDSEQLERVVESLLTNAVKFTEDGGHVQWSLSIENGRAVIDVVDDGIGIAEDEQAHLFTRFFRSRAAQERAIQGSGLGLAIAQWIVHGHGGEISVRSREDVGTSVRVELPLLASHHRLDT
jgi:signal transduction histidine kinase